MTVAVVYVALPDNSCLLSEILKSELTAEVDQLQENEELVRSQRSELEEEFKRFKKFKCLFSLISKSLRKICHFVLCVLVVCFPYNDKQ